MLLCYSPGNAISAPISNIAGILTAEHPANNQIDHGFFAELVGASAEICLGHSFAVEVTND